MQCAPLGRMPNAERGCHDVHRTLVKAMFGMVPEQEGWNMASTILAVHGMGRARLDRSGYDGAWVDEEF